MLGTESFTTGALMGLRLGLGLGFLNILTFQLLGTGTVDWAVSKSVGAV
jgi:hypothetical protein